MSKSFYDSNYFNSKIFNYDYTAIADAIIYQYSPKTIIEFGCGNGELSKSFAAQNINVVAIDGYSIPDFSDIKNISFKKVDLNDPVSVNSFVTSLNSKFDIAICMEVAEHLNPLASEELIRNLTKVTDTIIFSAAIPGQDGDGHINCRSRVYWHKLFEENSFFLRDTIRSKIRDNTKVGRWYALNTVDYTRISGTLTASDYNNLISNLIDSESEASSHFYLSNRKLDYKNYLLNLDIIKYSFTLRNFVKKVLGKPTLPFTK